jgi:hypothetical protein
LRVLDIVWIKPQIAKSFSGSHVHTENIAQNFLLHPKRVHFAAIIIIIIGKYTISFMQGIYTYIPETNHVPKEYNVAAILSLLFMAPLSLAPVLAVMYFTSALFEVCVQCLIWQFSVVP